MFILIRCLRELLDVEETRFLKDTSHLEPSWLITAKGACTERSENMQWAR